MIGESEKAALLHSAELKHFSCGSRFSWLKKSPLKIQKTLASKSGAQGSGDFLIGVDDKNAQRHPTKWKHFLVWFAFFVV